MGADHQVAVVVETVLIIPTITITLTITTTITIAAAGIRTARWRRCFTAGRKARSRPRRITTSARAAAATAWPVLRPRSGVAAATAGQEGGKGSVIRGPRRSMSLRCVRTLSRGRCLGFGFEPLSFGQASGNSCSTRPLFYTQRCGWVHYLYIYLGHGTVPLTRVLKCMLGGIIAQRQLGGLLLPISCTFLDKSSRLCSVRQTGLSFHGILCTIHSNSKQRCVAATSLFITLYTQESSTKTLLEGIVYVSSSRTGPAHIPFFCKPRACHQPPPLTFLNKCQ